MNKKNNFGDKYMIYNAELIEDIINIVENESENSYIDSDRVGEMLTLLSEERTRYLVGESNIPKEEYDEMINVIHSALTNKVDSFDVGGFNVRLERNDDGLTRVGFFVDNETNIVENYAFIDENNGYPINEETIANNVIFIKNF